MTPTGFTVPDRVYGVDFSAAAADAGRNTWVASGRVKDERLVVHRCEPASEFLGSDPHRSATMTALREFVRDLGSEAAIGFDFPFGLPRFLVESVDADRWREFIEWFPGAAEDPDDLSAWGVERTRAHTHGTQTYAKRKTDREENARSAYGFIAKYPTFYGLRDVLRPLVTADDVAVPPMDSPVSRGDRPLVLETYPAAILERRGEFREGYKSGCSEARFRRRANLEALRCDRTITITSGLRERLIQDTGGDGLDAFAAAVAAHANTRAVDTLESSDPDYLLEARIFT